MDAGVAENWEVYGNVFYHTADYGTPPNNEGVGGVIRVIRSDGDPGAIAHNWKIYNNSIINLRGLWSGFRIDEGTNNVAYNNLWYNSVRTAHLGVQISHSWYFNTPRDGDDDQVQMGSGDPFRDLEGGDFRLAFPTEPGKALSAPYQQDPMGHRRGLDGVWDRGAFEYVGEATSFADVPPSHWAHNSIESLYRVGYVAGCSLTPRKFCPEAAMTRAEGAVFVERGIHGAEYLPIEPQDPTFADVPAFEWFFKWAEGLWQDGYTAGCGADPLLFCPLQGHTRAEASVFFVRMLHGKEYEPPQTYEQVYADVPVGVGEPWYTKWVMAAFADGLIQICEDEANRSDDRYRPSEDISRAEAACMMALAKALGNGP
jgi:hypothetical protein